VGTFVIDELVSCKRKKTYTKYYVRICESLQLAELMKLHRPAKGMFTKTSSFLFPFAPYLMSSY